MRRDRYIYLAALAAVASPIAAQAVPPGATSMAVELCGGGRIDIPIPREDDDRKAMACHLLAPCFLARKLTTRRP
jgi:hypothetical protein